MPTLDHAWNREALLEMQPPPLPLPASYQSSCLTPDTLFKPMMAVYDYARARQYEGWDLYDGLNSRLFQWSPLAGSSWCRLALIQLCKRSVVNLRPWLLVPRTFNAKGGALFLLGQLNLWRYTGHEQAASEAFLMFHRLRHVRIERARGCGWGYPFDWQARAFMVPQGTPNLVASVYAGRALLAYEQHFSDPIARGMAKGVADFILNEMVVFESEQALCFRYIPGECTEVHNASLLAAAYLAQTLHLQPPDQQSRIREQILKAVRYAVADIQPDGAWPYGTQSFHRWVDNFHTAFNLESLLQIREILSVQEFDPALVLALDYYLYQLFTPEGQPRYYPNRRYPVDVHVLAQTVIMTRLLRHYQVPLDAIRLSQIEHAVLDLVGRFQDPTGYFYTQQISERVWSRIPYIRWGQAWMFYALSTCLRVP